MIIRQIPSLRAYARLLVGERFRADDLVQDCLERAWSRLHLFRGDGDIRVWLFTIMHNLYVSDIRREQRRPAVIALAEHDELLRAPPREELRLELEYLARALSELPEEQRAAVLLVGVEDMSYEQAAAVLGIPVGTLMSRLYRGRKRLRILMSGKVEPALKRVK
ncbi:MAG TPA: sigma-70 family RNA polymerase sigma factor [Burkholderiales bacterium]|nr:sigma-70 family RNA polymerase sigma factor [Burkholderiales bacterium]